MQELKETHITGLLSVEINIKSGIYDFGIQISEDGRVWICIDGCAFIRFKPLSKGMLEKLKENKNTTKETC